MSDDHAARMNGKVRGIALSGKAAESWERIFGGGRSWVEPLPAPELVPPAVVARVGGVWVEDPPAPAEYE